MLNKASILSLLETNDRAVARALVVLNQRQTSDEQVTENRSEEHTSELQSH